MSTCQVGFVLLFCLVALSVSSEIRADPHIDPFIGGTWQYGPFIRCMARHLSMPPTHTKDLYVQCVENELCWLQKARKSLELVRTIKAIRDCSGNSKGGKKPVSEMKEEQIPFIETTPAKVKDPFSFLKCVAACLGKDVQELLPIFEKCHFDYVCWLMEVGEEAAKCITKCPKTFNDVSPATSLACVAKKIGKSSLPDIVHWLEHCGLDVPCWLSRARILWSAAKSCLAGSPKDTESVQKTYVEKMDRTIVEYIKNNDFVHCMADCLKKSIAQIIQWYQECATDVNCWLKKAGIAALQCVPKCI